MFIKFHFLLFFLIQIPFTVFASSSFSANIEHLSDYSLSEKEIAWLISHKEIKHGVVASFPPLEYIDKQGVYQGFTSDYIKIIGDKLNIRFEQKAYSNGKAIEQALRKNEVSLSLFLTNKGREVKNIHFSPPIIQIPIVLIGKENGSLVPNLETLDTKIVAVQKQSTAYFLFNQRFPSTHFYLVNNASEGLQTLNAGKADFFIHNSLSANYFQRRMGITDNKVILSTPFSYEIRFSTSNEAKMLLSIIDKIMPIVTQREHNLIFEKWANIQIEREFDWHKASIWGGLLLCISVSLIGIVLYWNQQLSIKVAERTHALEERSNQLRNLARHLENVREQEKTRLSREIHDELGHTLTALNMGVGRLAHLKHKSDNVFEKKLSEVKLLVSQAIATSRKIMSDLRPSILEDFGLVAALEWLTDEFSSYANIDCQLCATPLPDLSDEMNIAIFRITQECLTNSAKHSHASNISVCITHAESHLELRISDNGRGLKDGWQDNEHSLGFQGMKERVNALGGTIEIQDRSQDGVNGVSLHIRIRC